MVEKRFVLDNGEESEYFVDLLDKYDDGSPKSYWFLEHEDFCEVVDLLNELYDEGKKFFIQNQKLMAQNLEMNKKLKEYEER